MIELLTIASAEEVLKKLGSGEFAMEDFGKFASDDPSYVAKIAELDELSKTADFPEVVEDIANQRDAVLDTIYKTAEANPDDPDSENVLRGLDILAKYAETDPEWELVFDHIVTKVAQDALASDPGAVMKAVGASPDVQEAADQIADAVANGDTSADEVAANADKLVQSGDLDPEDADALVQTAAAVENNVAQEAAPIDADSATSDVQEAATGEENTDAATAAPVAPPTVAQVATSEPTASTSVDEDEKSAEYDDGMVNSAAGEIVNGLSDLIAGPTQADFAKNSGMAKAIAIFVAKLLAEMSANGLQPDEYEEFIGAAIDDALDQLMGTSQAPVEG